jgi:hypothetical protein
LTELKKIKGFYPISWSEGAIFHSVNFLAEKSFSAGRFSQSSGIHLFTASTIFLFFFSLAGCETLIYLFCLSDIKNGRLKIEF